METHDGVFWLDSISVFSHYEISKVYRHVISSRGFLMFRDVQHSVLATTHRKMYTYLPTNLDLLRIQALAAGAMLVYRTPFVLQNILLPAIMCSLEHQCIAPTRKLLCTPRLLLVLDRYIDCHRYDMSMINILALNAYDFQQSLFYHNSTLLQFNRGKANVLETPLKMCTGHEITTS